MSHDTSTTYHAPVERAPHAEIARQAALFAHSDMTRLLDCVSDSILILNRERQAVFANKALLDLLGPDAPAEILGLRMGELVKCRNADATEGGCGTSPFCRYCGAVNTALASIRDDAPQAGECHLLMHTSHGEEALDLRVSASPVVVNDERFTVLALSNSAGEQAKLFLERIFLHDTLNAARALAGFSDLLSREEADAEQRDYLVQRIGSLSQRLIDEINAQQQLMAAEQGRLVPEAAPLDTLAFLKTLVAAHGHEALHDRKQLLIDAHAQSISLTTDEQLLRQVIGNMVRNALDASRPGETVTIGCTLHHDRVHFSVTNPAYMPEETRAHIFRRSVSTRGTGKGLGTYRMKYLTEHCLRGTITFATSEQDGTTFTASYPLAL